MTAAPHRQPAETGAIRARLLAPERQATLGELAQCWFVETVELTVEGYGKLAADPALPGRLRGAFGQALIAGASDAALAGLPCTFDPPSAFEALFRKQGRMTAGLDFPGAWVIGVTARGSDLVAALSLFGFAADWAAAAAEAFTQAAKHLVNWKGANALFLPKLRIASRICREAAGIAYPETPMGVELLFTAPLAFTGADPRQRPASLLTGLGARLSGLARWHDLGLDERCDWRAFKAAAAELRYGFADIEAAEWQRGSTPQDRAIPMRGMWCRLLIAGDLAPVAAALALGETCHMGADIAFGCGRYRILGWD